MSSLILTSSTRMFAAPFILCCFLPFSAAVVINTANPCQSGNCTKTELEGSLPCFGLDCPGTETEELPTCEDVVCPELSRAGCAVELTFPDPNNPYCACEACEKECTGNDNCIQAGPNCRQVLTTYPSGYDCPPCLTCGDEILVVNVAPTEAPAQRLSVRNRRAIRG
ncbi:uncharacterized protein [Watersipora subatra]|uniref:uncharacterized protein n=1 Tax=Watersipora subatra TaxID=2589382 RepID=UPI00355C2E05